MFNIIREAEFDKVIEELTIDHSRMDDLDSAIDWALGKAPDKIPNAVQISANYYLWVTDEFYDLDIPVVRILYKIDTDNNQVILLAISEVESENEAVFF